MTLYIKGTDTVIVGTLEQMTGTGLVPALTENGSIAWGGGTKVDWDSQHTVMDGDLPVWIDDEGTEHRGVEVEDRRDDGTIIAYAQPHKDPVRPVTPQILQLWRHSVANFQTKLSAKEWSDNLTVRDWLFYHGLILADRDPYINANFEGEWQITNPYDPLDHPEPDASNLGFFAVVGDDVDELFNEAIDWLVGFSDQ